MESSSKVVVALMITLHAAKDEECIPTLRHGKENRDRLENLEIARRRGSHNDDWGSFCRSDGLLRQLHHHHHHHHMGWTRRQKGSGVFSNKHTTSARRSLTHYLE